MAHSRKTLSLSEKWDLQLDGSGRITLNRAAMATAQNVANEARLFTEDAYFIQDQGVPHFIIELGFKQGNTASLRSYLRNAALNVPDVAEVLDISIDSFDPVTRTLSGSIGISTNEGETSTATVRV